MSAPSLYRRHRPRTFEDVVGQDHVVRTLRNAVEQGKVHHAYLFVGSRGTGKTSMAKILASCLDCVNGPTATPCGVCEYCVAIQRATSLDVVEMDAASNNSVDDVRELRERVQTAPSGGRWRVYILDEAHMLTTQAWNALLKTLEEPPPQTVFVLATTEAHKVPATVVDRTHRFDFTRPTGEQISRVLARVAEKESLTMTPGALALVARNANGSFRDALGTLEQLVTYAGDSVTEQDAVTVLGIGDDAQVFGAVDAVIAGDAAGVLRVVQEVASHGRDLGSYARELERHGRDLLVCCILGGVPPEVRLTPDRDQQLDDQARRIGRDQATRLLELLATALTAARDGADGRAMLELALVKAADPSIDPALRALQARLSRIEEHLSGRGAVPAGAAPSAPQAAVSAAPAPAAPAPAQPTPAPAPAAAAPAPVAPAPPREESRPEAPRERAESPRAAEPPRAAGPARSAEPPRAAEPPRSAEPPQRAPEPSREAPAPPAQRAPEPPRPQRVEPPAYDEPPVHEWDDDPRAGEPAWDELPPAAALRDEPAGDLHRVADPQHADPNGLRAVPPPGARGASGEGDRGGHGNGSLAAVPPPAQYAERSAPVPQHAEPPRPAAPEPVAAPAQSAPAEGGNDFTGGHTIEELVSVWGAVVENLRGRDMLCASAIAQSRPAELDGNEITIVFPMDAAFYRGTADREERRLALREALREVTGTTFSARFELRDLADSPPIEIPAATNAPRPPAPAPAAQPAPAPEARDQAPATRPAPATYTSPSATLDENAVVAHLVTEFDAEEINDDPGPEEER